MLYSHILPSHATWGYRGSPTVPTKKAFFLDKTLPKATIVAPTTGLRILQAQSVYFQSPSGFPSLRIKYKLLTGSLSTLIPFHATCNFTCCTYLH